ncbi:MAG: choice-of-anchor K domain-containing protein [Phormidesmis sp.]
MLKKPFYTLLGAGAAMATLGAVAAPADAFVLTSTSGSWDNVTLTGVKSSDGTKPIIGSDGDSAAYWNSVEFLQVGDESQVRFGDSVDSTYHEWAYNEEDNQAGYATTAKWNYEWKYEWKYSYYYGYYKDWYKDWSKEYYHYDYVEDYTQKSGLGFEGVNDLNIEMGDIFNIGSLTHFNQAIWANGKAADSAELSIDLDFGDFGIGKQTFDFQISIDETINNTTGCAYYTEEGNTCSDKVAWDWAIDESNTFEHEGEEYTLELVGFADSFNSSNIVDSFISQEGGDNSASIFARLVTVDRTQDIPEPASLFGLAGLGLYFARSRKKQAAQSYA